MKRRKRTSTGGTRSLNQQEKAVSEQEKKLTALVEKERLQLESIAKMSAEEAKRFLMETMENEAKHEAAKKIKKIEEEAKEIADKKSKEIISLAIQRYAGEYVAERTVSVVNLPNEEMKGRIIGREGRNIRALEAATGVDLIIDDTPEAVILSGFNPIRREIARIALERSGQRWKDPSGPNRGDRSKSGAGDGGDDPRGGRAGDV